MKEIMVESASSQMRKGVLELCTLRIIEKNKKVYASEILRELKASEMIVVEGTLYPLLSRLKSQGLLKYEWEESKSGPPRKYYSLTEKGDKALKSLKETWKEFSSLINTLLK